MADNNDNDEEQIEIDSVGPGDGSFESKISNKSSAAQEELARCKSDMLYLRADFDNYRKSVIRERSDLVKYGSERVFVALLDVLDNLERALEIELTPDSLPNFKEGVALTATEFKKAFTQFGVKSIECDGQAFDPALHEALSSEETDKIEPGHIARVFKKAYKLHDRVIRPAQVVVAKQPKSNS